MLKSESQRLVIITYPPPYLLLNVQLYGVIVFANPPYQRKLQAWSRCDWPAYHTSVIAAKRAQAVALHHHQRSLTKLQSGTNDCMWWNLAKNISGLCKTYN